MKTKNLLLIAVFGVTMIACGSAKKTATQPPSTAPFNEVHEAPCAMYDDDTYFAATGIASGPATQKGSLQRAALANGQAMIRQKMEHAYQGVVSDFMEHIGNNQGNDVEQQMIAGGDQIIMAIVNDTSHSCLMFSNVDAKGNVECYIGIRIIKQKVVEAIADNLSKNQKAEIRQHAEEFRAQAREKIKAYKEQ